MGKYKIGDKVRMVSKPRLGWNIKGGMGEYCDKVMTVSGFWFGFPGLYQMEEDKSDNFGHGWCWSDEDIVGLVKGETPKQEEKVEEKIVITHDGKVTTATLYGVMNDKVTATARCAPEDTFDFKVGAELAMERLMEKVKPITVGGFKIGDRVNYKGVNGTIICFARYNDHDIHNIGVEFDKPNGICHNCGGVTLKAGTVGTKGTSRWLCAEQLTMGEVPEEPKEKKHNSKFKTGDYAKIVARKYGHHFKIGTIVKLKKGSGDYLAFDDNDESWWVMADELEPYTPPKYYNGKVVCVDNKGNPNNYTIGKVYEFKDGVITTDKGHELRANNPVTSFEDWAAWSSSKFVELVE